MALGVLGEEIENEYIRKHDILGRKCIEKC